MCMVCQVCCDKNNGQANRKASVGEENAIASLVCARRRAGASGELAL